MVDTLDKTQNCLYEPTLNQMGYMVTQIDQIGCAFLKFAQEISHPVLDIGAAYGHIALEAAKRKISIIANDLDVRHLDVIKNVASEDQLNYITLLLGRFPDQLSFQSSTLGAVLICRVLHFFLPHEWLSALQALHRWLVPGGKVFMTNESPYFGTMRQFIPIYLERKRKGHPWPGLMTGMEHFDTHRKKDVDAAINLLSLQETKTVLEAAGFRIEYIGYLNREGVYPADALYDGRETVGVIATKK